MIPIFLAVGEGIFAGRADLQGVLDRHQFVPLVDEVQNLVAEQHLVALPDLVGIERHELDEADFEALAPAHLHQFQNFRFREILHGDRINFDGFESDLAGCGQAVQHLLQAVAPVDVREFLRIQVLRRRSPASFKAWA